MTDEIGKMKEIQDAWNYMENSAKTIGELIAENAKLRESWEEANTIDVKLRARIADLEAVGSDIPCCKCSKEVIEFTVPNELWNIVMRLDGHETDKEYLCFDCWNSELMKFIERLQSAERWIPVSTWLLPPKNTDVLVYNSEAGNVFTACRGENGWYDRIEGVDLTAYDNIVTHWRELPQPPSESQVDNDKDYQNWRNTMGEGRDGES